MKARVIIGANYGDEGKGMTTDYLCRKLKNCIVIRFNGGAQAGHTVITPSGERMVFSHLGSGTFTKTPTYLSEHFIANPVAYLKELNKFVDEFDTRPLVESIVHIHPNAPVTTPFDVMMNWAVENKRRASASQHGSCGLGINETVTRQLTGNFSLTIADLIDLPESKLRNKLQHIRSEYYKHRAHELEDFIDKDWYEDFVIEEFIIHCRNFISFVRVVEYETLNQYDHLVFEGAQGLLLDEVRGGYPHVTRSRTGLPNVEDVMDAVGIKDADVYYITRSYLTRHGAGQLPFEVDYKIYPAIEDRTNIDNHFQGKLRFAPLNLSLLREAVDIDLRSTNLNIAPHLVVTCVNQLPDGEDECKYVEDGIEFNTSRDNMLRIVWQGGRWDKMIISSSPTYEHFTVYQPS